METAFFIILLAGSAFFSSSESAFLSLGRIKLRQIAGLGHSSAKRVVRLLEDPNKLLVTILAGNNLVNIGASAILASIFFDIYGETSVPLSIVTMTVILLIFGEVTPKMFALTHSVRFSFLASLPLLVCEKILFPVRWVMTNLSYSIVRGFGVKVTPERPKMTAQEIRSLFSMGRKLGVVKKKEKDMIQKIFDFKELNAADIMTPRIDIVALDLTRERYEIIDQLKKNSYSRYPVYVHTLDNIAGILHSKDVLLNKDISLQDLVKKPFFVPESMRLDDLLQNLQKQHLHMAIVTDEYGVTSGLVTIEDILEEIVGEIRDEFDFEQPNIRKLDQKNFELSGQTHVDEVNQQLGLEIETDKVDTIGGYVILRMGYIPQAGDTIEINGTVVTVNDVSKNRITSLNIRKKT